MQEKIFLTNSNKQKICGILSIPKHKEPDVAIIMCHGLGSSKDDSLFKKLQHATTILDITTLNIDMIGHGESDGHYTDITLTEVTEDIIKAYKKLQSLGFTRIGFVGHSFGACGAIMAAPKVKFSFMVLISPPTYYDISEIFTSTFYVLREYQKVKKNKTDNKKIGIQFKFFRDYSSQDSYAAAKHIKAPVLIIHADDDKIVPIARSRELRNIIKGSKMLIFKGAGHHYSHPVAEKKLVEEVIFFVNKHVILK